jgi:hypothetical protein
MIIETLFHLITNIYSSSSNENKIQHQDARTFAVMAIYKNETKLWVNAALYNAYTTRWLGLQHKNCQLFFTNIWVWQDLAANPAHTFWSEGLKPLTTWACVGSLQSFPVLFLKLLEMTQHLKVRYWLSVSILYSVFRSSQNVQEYYSL